MKRLHQNQIRSGILVLLLTQIAACSDSGSVDVFDEGPLVPPYPGSWFSELDEELEFDSIARDDQYFSTNYEVTARLKDPVARCGIAMDGTSSINLEGTVFGNQVSLYPPGSNRETPCMTGVFSNLITLDATLDDGSTRRFRGVRVQVNLNRDNGIWVSEDGGKTRVIFVNPNAVNNNFSTPVSACVVSRDVDINLNLGGEEVITTKIVGQIAGFQTASNAPPIIDVLSDLETGESVFTDLVFSGYDLLTGFTGDGEPVRLRRMPVPSDSDIYDICSVSDFP